MTLGSCNTKTPSGMVSNVRWGCIKVMGNEGKVKLPSVPCLVLLISMWSVLRFLVTFLMSSKATPPELPTQCAGPQRVSPPPSFFSDYAASQRGEFCELPSSFSSFLPGHTV